tara:strand:- start:161 stop:385 length:225 start_codon:yes stop_codon:yes gene_type:complete
LENSKIDTDFLNSGRSDVFGLHPGGTSKAEKLIKREPLFPSTTKNNTSLNNIFKLRKQTQVPSTKASELDNIRL